MVFLALIGLSAFGIILLVLLMNRPQEGIGGAITGTTETPSRGITGREERINKGITYLTIIWLVLAFLYDLFFITT